MPGGVENNGVFRVNPCIWVEEDEGKESGGARAAETLTSLPDFPHLVSNRNDLRNMAWCDN